MEIIKVQDFEQMSKVALDLFCESIQKKPNIILGLATGSTPIGLYKGLVKMYQAGNLDFSKVKSFNLDEYYPISPDNNQSYIYFMKENLFNHVNIDLKNVNVPNGEAKDADIECSEYDKKIEAAGGVDLQLLGVGTNGHIGFNEPGEALYASTHKTGLTQDTLLANARFFNNIEEMPKEALTMGCGTILKAKRIVILLSGKNKHDAFLKLTSGRMTTACPVTLLQLHSDVVVIADEAAVNG